MTKHPFTGSSRIIAAFRNSLAGFKDIWKREEAFRQEIYLLLIGLLIGPWISTSFSHFGLLIGSILILIIAEVLNSAIEATVDRIGPDIHELSRIAKDLGSLAVLLTALIPLSVWSFSLFQLMR